MFIIFTTFNVFLNTEYDDSWQTHMYENYTRDLYLLSSFFLFCTVGIPNKQALMEELFITGSVSGCWYITYAINFISFWSIYLFCVQPYWALFNRFLQSICHRYIAFSKYLKCNIYYAVKSLLKLFLSPLMFIWPSSN